jgi:hypothetical protein
MMMNGVCVCVCVVRLPPFFLHTLRAGLEAALPRYVKASKSKVPTAYEQCVRAELALGMCRAWWRLSASVQLSSLSLSLSLSSLSSLSLLSENYRVKSEKSRYETAIALERANS